MIKQTGNPATRLRPARSGRAALGLGASLLSVAALGIAVSPALAEEKAAKPAAAEERQSGVEVIFTGFSRAADQGARIFVHLTGEVPIAEQRHGNTITYRLSGAKLGVANNANPLPTRHFGPPVSRVSLVAAKDGVDLVIELSRSSQPTHRLVSAGGISTLHVELPAGSE
jgi:hypothetical protein